ncbi:hypothetical protein M2440_001515 [Methylorubrum extorquens]|nr:hypothetical protein [Methylorubrum extorquens]MDF9862520.1 hypothetical protein [Methylorubrum pseudosasae]MDH6665308.1 hypothetical protein [Methylorubrum zatmanii]
MRAQPVAGDALRQGANRREAGVEAADPVGEAVEAAAQIEVGRERFDRARAAASRPPLPIPLAGSSGEELLAIFRQRLESLAGARAAVVERADLEADPDRPTLPRLRASVRGTAEGLQGLLHALETESPLVAVEEAELGIERAADRETGRPTVMRASLIARGVLIPPPVPGATP